MTSKIKCRSFNEVLEQLKEAHVVHSAIHAFRTGGQGEWARDLAEKLEKFVLIEAATTQPLLDVTEEREKCLETITFYVNKYQTWCLTPQEYKAEQIDEILTDTLKAVFAYGSEWRDKIKSPIIKPLYVD